MLVSTSSVSFFLRRYFFQRYYRPNGFKENDVEVKESDESYNVTSSMTINSDDEDEGLPPLQENTNRRGRPEVFESSSEDSD